MIPTIWLVLLLILVSIILLTVSITSAIGTVKAHQSSAYPAPNSKMKNAHTYLLIATCLGWSSIAIMLVVIIVGLTTHLFYSPPVSDVISKKTTPTKEDLKKVLDEINQLSSSRTIQWALLFALIVVTIFTIIMGIMAVIASIEIGGITVPLDSYAKQARTMAVITAVISLVCIFFLVVSLVVYIMVRKSREKELEKLEKIEENAAQQIPGAENSTQQTTKTTIIKTK